MIHSDERTRQPITVKHSNAGFTNLADLASSRVGGRAIAASDDFFASKSNLVKPAPPIFIAGKFTSRGKWMDGWESRRRRTPGHDWCVIALGIRGVIHGLTVDTTHFSGNHPEHCSVEAFDSGDRRTARAFNPKAASWITILHKSPLGGDREHFFPIEDGRAWTHVRLNIHPDGGVARLRVYGQPAIDWTRFAGRPIDLASIVNGGLVIGASDMHFGARDNLIMPGRALNMGDGWETRRRRSPGHDWVVVRLGAPGHVRRVEIDTNHFKGNYPDSASIDGCFAPDADLESLRSTAWFELLAPTKLRPHHRHLFARALSPGSIASHVRLNIFPDGGVSRLRIHGTVAEA